MAVKANGLQKNVDVRRFKQNKKIKGQGAAKWRIDLYSAGNYLCEVDGEQYIFSQVLSQKARDAGATGAMNAIYRLSAAPATAVLLYGVKALALETINASGWIEVITHMEAGEDTFTEVEA